MILFQKNERFLTGSEEACQDQLNVIQMCLDDQENNQVFDNPASSRDVESCRNFGT